MQKQPPFSSFIHPKYWPTWFGLGLLYILAWMPFFIRTRAGQCLGMLTYWLAKERRYITSINIKACFPELDTSQQRDLIRNSFQEYGIGLVETSTGWVRKPDTFRKQTTVIGLDNVQTAQKQGKGVLLIGAHFSTLDFGANLISRIHPFGVTYRPQRNALFDAFMLRGRLSNCNGVFDRNDIRGAFRHLKQGKSLWYAPDQDYGPDHAVYVPFFGNQAATITTASRFSAFNQSPVFMLRQHRVNRTNQYEIEFIPFPEDFPSEDESKDALIINQIIEKTIRMYPAQYLWMHKRFKTQPGGKPESPYINIRTPNHRLTEAQYDQVLSSAEQIAEIDNVCDYKLKSGLWLRQYPGIIQKHPFNRHPARLFDRNAKALRTRGFNTITVDNFFRIPRKKLSAATYFIPAGKLLSAVPANDIPLELLARFIARLHDAGIECKKPVLDMFLIDNETIAIIDPTHFELRQAPVKLKFRRDAVISMVKSMGLSSDDSTSFFNHYAEAAGLALAGITSA